jgi:two-component system, NtrC family, sensor histidine kinase AtoS
MRCIIAASGASAVLELIKPALKQEHQYLITDTSAGIIDLLLKTTVDLVIIDENLDDMAGIEALRLVRREYPELGTIFLVSGPDDESAATAMSLSVSGCVEKSQINRRLEFAAQKAFERAGLLRKLELLQSKSAPGIMPVAETDFSGKDYVAAQREIMRRLSRAITTIHDIDRIPALIIEAVVESLNPSTAVVLVRGKRGYQPGATHGTDPAFMKDMAFEKGRGVIGWLQQNGRILYSSEVLGLGPIDATAQISADMERLRSAMLIPMVHDGELFGILGLGPKFTGVSYSQSEIDLLSTVAEYGALAVHNSVQYSKVQRDQACIQSILDHVACGIIAVDENSTIMTVNPHAEELLDISAPELAGQKSDALPAGFAGIMARALGNNEMFESHELKDDQSDRTYSITTSLIKNARGGILGAVMFFFDLSTVKKLEDKVHGLERVEFWSNLSGRMAHEIKNPLVAIKTFTQLLPERYEDSDFRENFSEIVNKAIDKINNITEHLMAYSKPIMLQVQPVEVSNIVEQALVEANGEIKTKDITVTSEIPKELPLLEVDAEQVKLALFNVVSNSVDFMPPGGSITISARAVGSDHLQSRPDDIVALNYIDHTDVASAGFVEISVFDNGPGIEPENLPRVFMPFFSTKIQGMGLGLAIVRNVIQEHGGRIEIESFADKGTTCRIFLPIAASAPSVKTGTTAKSKHKKAGRK